MTDNPHDHAVRVETCSDVLSKSIFFNISNKRFALDCCSIWKQFILGFLNDALIITLLRKDDSADLSFTSPHGVISTFI
jgi:hypothetical protein